jgi:hypothetical protein
VPEFLVELRGSIVGGVAEAAGGGVDTLGGGASISGGGGDSDAKLSSSKQLDCFQPKIILSRSNTMRWPDIKFCPMILRFMLFRIPKQYILVPSLDVAVRNGFLRVILDPPTKIISTGVVTFGLKS